jgi:acyl-CoA dehydrogenase
MNFDFSDDVTVMREEVRRVLRDCFPRGAVRLAVDEGQRFDRDFWRELGAMGWLGVAIPEEYGGAGLGHEALCMIAEEVGAALPPVPFASSVCQASEALLLFGSEAQKAAWLPKLARGEIVGCLALAEGPSEPRALAATGSNGVKWPVMDGDIADIAIVASGEGLWLVELAGQGVSRAPVETLDIVRGATRLDLRNAAAEKLEGADLPRLLDRLAILAAFEAVGGAQTTLDMAVDYAKERYAFGRPIASFQAIKHKLADIYVALELARSNAYYGAWALDNEADLPVAASAARLAANQAYSLAAQENIQTHGGLGFTWESDCHLHYRRARTLALQLGSSRYWRDRLIDHLDQAEAA